MLLLPTSENNIDSRVKNGYKASYILTKMWLFVIHLQRSEITITKYFLNKENKKHAQVAEPHTPFLFKRLQMQGFSPAHKREDNHKVFTLRPMLTLGVLQHRIYLVHLFFYICIGCRSPCQP